MTLAFPFSMPTKPAPHRVYKALQPAPFSTAAGDCEYYLPGGAGGNISLDSSVWEERSEGSPFSVSLCINETFQIHLHFHNLESSLGKALLTSRHIFSFGANCLVSLWWHQSNNYSPLSALTLSSSFAMIHASVPHQMPQFSRLFDSAPTLCYYKSD